MHPNADPDVIAWWIRHPQSVAIEQNTYLGDSELSDQGKEQIAPLKGEIRRLEPDVLLCSKMFRTTAVAFADTPYLIRLEEELSEWPRIPEMIGRSNDDADVEEYLEGRMRRFMEGNMLPEEEAVEDTIQKMIHIEFLLRDLANLKPRLKRAVRVPIISHGNRHRQFKAWLKAKGDVQRFKEIFLDLYESEGLEPAAITPPFWYGQFFRKGVRGWNWEAGWNGYLPRHLRESEI